MRTGRPHRLKHGAEWELFCLHVGGATAKTCAEAFDVSLITAKRIIARFKHRYGERAGQLARDFRYRLEQLRDST